MKKSVVKYPVKINGRVIECDSYARSFELIMAGGEPQRPVVVRVPAEPVAAIAPMYNEREAA